MPHSPCKGVYSAGLYIHVPFCARKCAYCAFYSEASTGELMSRYVAALIREMEWVAGQFRPRTVFFGGGTPSLLNLRQWESILGAMDRLDLLGAEEWTVECNPATVSLDKAKLLRDHGVNRISMGVQSLDEPLLERLGRVHSRAMVFKSFDVLRHAGFGNLNIDLMFAIPGQTRETWQRTLGEAIALGSEHLSSYEVIYEEDTPLFAQLQSGELTADEDLACAMYEDLLDRAEASGLRQYEIANFARDADVVVEVSDCDLPGRACLHNVNYWRGGPFYGLGPSAVGYVGGVRAKNCPDTRLYCGQIEQGTPPIAFREELSPLARAGETAAFGLRMVSGWGFEEFRHRTGHDLRAEWSGEMNDLEERGWGRIGPDRFQLTRPGLRFADSAAALFLR